MDRHHAMLVLKALYKKIKYVDVKEALDISMFDMAMADAEDKMVKLSEKWYNENCIEQSIWNISRRFLKITKEM